MAAVLEVDGLVKRYGALTAVDGLSFSVEAGEIFGMVGPNGAGKTTTIECVEGLRRGDGGELRVLGLDPGTQTRRLHERIGIQLQESSLPLRMKVGEAVELFGGFYRRSRDGGELLERLDLAGKRGSHFAKLSGGQKQRLFIALALVNDPEIVFLDELTTGLDPHSRRDMWRLVLDIRERGKTVVLTTHFMEEAERLCDRVAIIDGGRLVALDTPAALIGGLDRDRQLVLTIRGDVELDELRSLPGIRRAERRGERLEVDGRGDELTGRLLRHVLDGGAEIRELHEERATLEDVFLATTGRPPADEPSGSLAPPDTEPHAGPHAEQGRPAAGGPASDRGKRR